MQDIKTSTPVTILGSLVAILAIFVWLYVFMKFYNNYRSSGKKQSQYFALGLLSGGIAIIFLALELVTFQLFDAGTTWGHEYIGKDIIPGINSYEAGIVFGIIAAVISSFAILFFVLFSLSFFEDKMKWIVFPGLLLLIYVILYLYYWPTAQLNAEGTDYDITRSGDIEAIMIFLFLIPIFFPVVVFFLSALQVRGNTFNFRRSLLLSFLFIVIGTGYTIEIVGGHELVSLFGRILILLFPVGVNLTLNPNNFVKRLLGAPT